MGTPYSHCSPNHEGVIAKRRIQKSLRCRNLYQNVCKVAAPNPSRQQILECVVSYECLFSITDGHLAARLGDVQCCSIYQRRCMSTFSKVWNGDWHVSLVDAYHQRRSFGLTIGSDHVLMFNLNPALIVELRASILPN